MRRSLVGSLLIALSALALVVSGSMSRGYAQTVVPSGDEFDASAFTAPFHVTCATLASPPCASTGDPQSATTWSLNGASPGNLRIMTQFGSLLGATNNARNLVLQPFSTGFDWTVSTQLNFPAASVNVTPLGQTAGLIVYQDDDNFIFVGRVFNQAAGGAPQIWFVQEAGGVDAITQVAETGFNPTVYLRLIKTGSLYQGSFSYDNVNWVGVGAGVAPGTATPTAATPTGTPTTGGYTAAYTSPRVGLFAFGGSNTLVASYMLPADFAWFRVGNSLTPAPTATATATSTSTATATATGTVVPAATSTPTVTATATATATPLPVTATATATPAPPTSTPIPTPTPTPPKPKAAFKYVSVWYHVVRVGTFNHIEAQGTKRTTYGIWVHVYMPSGVHFDYFDNTDHNGHWVKEFPVPRNARSPFGSTATVTFQLWKGKSSAKEFANFAVVR